MNKYDKIMSEPSEKQMERLKEIANSVPNCAEPFLEVAITVWRESQEEKERELENLRQLAGRDISSWRDTSEAEHEARVKLESRLKLLASSITAWMQEREDKHYMVRDTREPAVMMALSTIRANHPNLFQEVEK